MAICKSSTSRLRSRLVKTFVIICDFCGFQDFFLDLDQEVLDLHMAIETKSRYLDQDFSIVETKILKVSRFSRLSRPALCQCQDRESQSRHDRDKLRPRCLDLFDSAICKDSFMKPY